jgi:hypothetical protein
MSKKPRELDDLCHGQPCYLRFPGICSGNPAKVVPCHLRFGGVAGGSQKPPHICSLPGCFECHNVLDGRTPSNYSRTEIMAMTLTGYVQWMAKLWKNEVLIAVLS